MPSPEQTFQSIAADLEEVGITVNAVPEPWIAGLPRPHPGRPGTTACTCSAGPVTTTTPTTSSASSSARPSNEWGFNDPESSDAINDARYQTSQEEQIAAYEAANEAILAKLPGVPLAHPVPSLAFKPTVQGYPASPVQDEVYNVITIDG